MPIEVSGRYLGLMRLEEFSRLPTPEDDDKSYLRGNRSVNGLWSDGATLWVADGMSSQARLRGLDCPENAATSSEGCGVELGPEVPTGSRLTDDGRTLYFDTIPALTAYDLAGGHRIRSRDLPNTSTYVYEDSGFGANPGGGGARDGLVKPDGVWSDGTTIWVSDVSRVVKAYKVSSFAERTSTEAVAKLLPDRSLTMPTRSVPRGIWSDGTTIWVVDAFRDERVGVNRRPKMVAFDLASGARDDSRDITGLNGTPEGVWSDGVTMWVSTSPSSVSEGSRPGRDKVLAYWFNPEGGPAERDPGRDLKLATRTASGLWSDGEQMWVGDGGSGVHVYCLDSAASCHDAPPRSTDATTALVYAAGNIELASAIEQPTGIWSDGTTLYVAETDTNKIYRYTVDGEAQGTALALATGNTEPKGLWSDGTTMWVADSLDKKLYAYTLEPWAHDTTKDHNLPGLDRDTDPDFLSDNSLWGVWSNGSIIWVTNEFVNLNSSDTRGRVTAFNTVDGSVNDDLTFDLVPSLFSPQGISSDGFTMWVVDDGRNVLAYELDTGRRLPHKDIDTLAVGFEHISAFSRRTSVGIRSPLGIHIGDAGSAFPRILAPGVLRARCPRGASRPRPRPAPSTIPTPSPSRPSNRSASATAG